MSAYSELLAIEKCGMFWLSTAFMVAWPTFVTFVAFIYTKGSVIYTKDDGGKAEYSTLLGVVHHRPIEPGALEECSNSIIGPCYAQQSLTRPLDGGKYHLHYTEAGFGSLALLLDAYPTRNFLWTVNSNEATDISVQLVRRALGRTIIPEEEIGISELTTTSIDAIARLVALFWDYENVLRALRTMFIRGAVPDTRVFLLGSTVASVAAFVLGALTALFTIRQPSARQAARKTRLALSVFWDVLCLFTFAVGCWQIDSNRRAHQSVWPMFIYWIPSTSFISLKVYGFNVSKILGMVGVMMCVVARNELVCQGIR